MDELRACAGTQIPDCVQWPHVQKKSAASSSGGTAAAVPKESATMHTTDQLHSLTFQAKSAGIDVNAVVAEKGGTTIDLWRTLNLFIAPFVHIV